MARKRGDGSGPEKSGPTDFNIEFLTSFEDLKRTAEGQAEFALEVAEKLQEGSQINAFEAGFAAAILRFWAEEMPKNLKRPRGQKPVIDPGEVALRYALFVNGKGMGKMEAIGILADENGVSDEAIRKALKKYKEVALQMIPPNPNLKKE